MRPLLFLFFFLLIVIRMFGFISLVPGKQSNVGTMFRAVKVNGDGRDGRAERFTRK